MEIFQLQSQSFLKINDSLVKINYSVGDLDWLFDERNNDHFMV